MTERNRHITIVGAGLAGALLGALLWVFGFPGDKETDNSRCA